MGIEIDKFAKVIKLLLLEGKTEVQQCLNTLYIMVVYEGDHYYCQLSKHGILIKEKIDGKWVKIFFDVYMSGLPDYLNEYIPEDVRDFFYADVIVQ